MNNMEKEKKEQDSKLIYVDANCFIYGAIDQSKIGKNARKILSEINDGKYFAYTSTLTIDEFLWRVQKEVGRDSASEGAGVFFTLKNLDLINADAQIISKAIEIYRKERLDPRDAIHLASIQSKKISTIVSADPYFDKIKDIRRFDFSKMN